MMIRIMTLSLLVLLVQDVLSRVRRMRWLLTAMGLVIAFGAILKLSSQPSGPAVEAICLAGLAGVGMLLVPCCLPGGENRAELVIRVTLSALLAFLLVFSSQRTLAVGIISVCAVSGTLLLAGVFLKRNRVRLLLPGAVLGAGGVATWMQTGLAGWDWTSAATMFGAGGLGTALPSPDMSGAEILFVSAGWVGLGAIALGMLSSLMWSLYLSRNASSGDQARCVVWSVVAVLSGLGLMVRGGLGAPVVTVVAAVTWGLMPHVMAHPARRYRGWVVAVAFLAAMVVLGLENRVAGSAWVRPLLKEFSDSTMHFFGAFMLTAVVLWQGRCRTFRRAFVCAAIAAGVAVMGEPARSTFPPEARNCPTHCGISPVQPSRWASFALSTQRDESNRSSPPGLRFRTKVTYRLRLRCTYWLAGGISRR